MYLIKLTNGYMILYNKFGALLIQPLIGQYKKGEYSDEIILKANKLASKNSNQIKFLLYLFLIQDMQGLERQLFML